MLGCAKYTGTVCNSCLSGYAVSGTVAAGSLACAANAALANCVTADTTNINVNACKVC